LPIDKRKLYRAFLCLGFLCPIVSCETDTKSDQSEIEVIEEDLSIAPIEVKDVFIPSAYENGERLFKMNCASCHRIDKPAVGPKLTGAREEWVASGDSLQLLYEFIWDPIKIKRSGRSIRINNSNYQDLMKTPMPQLTKDQIDEILDYCDFVGEALNVKP